MIPEQAQSAVANGRIKARRSAVQSLPAARAHQQKGNLMRKGSKAENPKITTSIRIPAALHAAIKQTARREFRTYSAVIERVLSAWVRKQRPPE
jgi:hypothetical protein